MRVCLDMCCYNRPYDEAERFVSTVIREKFDYTRWQRDYFDGKTPEEIGLESEAFEWENPYKGTAVRL